VQLKAADGARNSRVAGAKQIDHLPSRSISPRSTTFSGLSPSNASFGWMNHGPIVLGDAAALVLGEWRLKRYSDPLSGDFSLEFRKLDGRWVIVHDHMSAGGGAGLDAGCWMLDT